MSTLQFCLIKAAPVPSKIGRKSDQNFSLPQVLECPKSGLLASQQVPRHMRRRAVSHNPKRLPVRLRAKHAAVTLKSEHKSADSKPKRPSRKYRR